MDDAAEQHLGVEPREVGRDGAEGALGELELVRAQPLERVGCDVAGGREQRRVGELRRRRRVEDGDLDRPR
ncbi:MAG TPA: hypothetical protein VLN26_16005, partial [Gaiellaceae bacterium]|nr:hypothetical protein [Gaiellaceae bacterium]